MLNGHAAVNIVTHTMA